MSDYSLVPNTITESGEVAVSGQRLARIEKALFGIRSSTLKVNHSDIISIDLPSKYGQMDLSSRPFYVRTEKLYDAIYVGENRPNIKGLICLGPTTKVLDTRDYWQNPPFNASGGLHLLVYKLYYQYDRAYYSYELVEEADVETMQEANSVRWPIAWIQKEVGSTPYVVAQIEQGYSINVPAIVI